MDKFTAKRILDEVMICYQAIKKATDLSDELLQDPEEKVAFVKALALANGELEDGPISKIIKQHPDLNPFLRNQK